MEQMITIVLALVSSLFTVVVACSDRQLKRIAVLIYAISLFAFVCVIFFRLWQGV